MFWELSIQRGISRQLVYGHFVYDTSSTDISSTITFLAEVEAGSTPTKMADTYGGEFEPLPCANPLPILVIRRPAATREPLSICDGAGDTRRAEAERNNNIRIVVNLSLSNK